MAAYLKHFPEYNLELGVAMGALTEDEVIQTLTSFDKKANWLGVYTQSADASGMDIARLPEIRRTVTPNEAESPDAKPKLSALVNLSESSELFLHFWTRYASTGVHRSRTRKVFNSVEAACQWLELPRGAAEKIAATVAVAEAETEVGPAEGAQARLRFVKSASRIFRDRGFEAMTLAEIVAAAGLPRGTLGRMAESKDDLMVHALLDAMGDIAPIQGDLAHFAAAYLSPAQKADVAGGCAMAALASDIESPEARAAMTAGLTWHIDRLSRIAPGEDAAGRRRAAVRAWSAMIGALILARMSDDEALSQEFLDDAQSWIADPAVAAAEATRSAPSETRPPA